MSPRQELIPIYGLPRLESIDTNMMREFLRAYIFHSILNTEDIDNSIRNLLSVLE